MEKPTKLKAHLFVCTSCTYQKECGEMSDLSEAQVFRDKLKSMCKEKWPKSDVRINSAGCLGQCEKGINALIYPQAEWLQNLRPNDETDLLERLSTILEGK